MAEYALDSRPDGKHEDSSHYLVVLAILLEELFTKDVLCGFFALAKDTKFVCTECGRGPSVCPDALCAAHRGCVRECVACRGVGVGTRDLRRKRRGANCFMHKTSLEQLFSRNHIV